MSRPPKPSLRAALEPVIASMRDPAQSERCRRALLGPEVDEPLADKILSALSDGLPRTVPEIGKLVHRRESVTKQTLIDDRRFVRVPAPHGRSGRAETWTLAPAAAGGVRRSTGAPSEATA